MKDLDLRLGNPEFLEPYWKKRSDSISIEMSNGIRYEKDGGQPALIQAIKDLHKKIGNAEVDNKFIVVGNGATHMLYSALNSHQNKNVIFRNPYYFKFPGIITQAGAKVTNIKEEAEVEIVVQPSNPTNAWYDPIRPDLNNKIFDLCYNWPEYGEVVLKDEDIMIFNMSKSTGHAASRIGWAICRNEKDALAIKEAIELTTGGVSCEAQLRATAIINEQVKLYNKDGNLDQSVFGYGKQELDSRWNLLLSLHVKGLKVLNNSGMFALCEYNCLNNNDIGATPFYNKYKILTVSAAQCGGEPNQLRINMGCKRKDFDEMINRLKIEVNN